MKKLVTLLLALVATTALWAYDFEVDGIYYNILTDKTNEVGVTSGDLHGGYSGSVTIPATVTYNGTTYSVTSIGYCAFADCSGLTSITIPNSVTSILEKAFSGCSGLTSITIPNSVTSIGLEAFNNCSGLVNPVYNAHCFAYMPTSYEGTYTIPEGIKQIAGGAFSGCRNLTSITIPNSVTSIGDGAFYKCFGLTSFTIPNSVTSIGNHAFWNSGLTSITIGNSVTSIGEGAFYGCYGLTSIVVEESNTMYDSRENCSAIIETASNTLIAGCQNTIIPNSVTSIGDGAFYGCFSLTSITIPNSVTSIGGSAFAHCYDLTSITIPNSVTSIGDYAFNNCSSLTKPVYNAHCFAYMPTSYEGAYTIPEGIKQIAGGAFSGCRNLTSITIPNSVTSIGYRAFDRCSGLTSIESLAETPPTLGSDAFYNVSTSIPVYVPCGSVSAYQSAEGWKYFTNIQCMPEDESAVDNVHSSSANTQKLLRNGQLIILRDGVEYNAQGQIIKE